MYMIEAYLITIRLVATRLRDMKCFVIFPIIAQYQNKYASYNYSRI